MDLLIFTALLAAAMILLSVIIALSRRGKVQQRKRIGSNLGLSPAKQQAWDSLKSSRALPDSSEANEIRSDVSPEFHPDDLKEIENLLNVAHAQETVAQDSRLLGVLEGVANRGILLTNIEIGEHRSTLIFADGTAVLLDSVGVERLKSLRSAIPQRVLLLEVSYAPPRLLLTFTSEKETLLLSSAKAKLL